MTAEVALDPARELDRPACHGAGLDPDPCRRAEAQQLHRQPALSDVEARQEHVRRHCAQLLDRKLVELAEHPVLDSGCLVVVERADDGEVRLVPVDEVAEDLARTPIAAGEVLRRKGLVAARELFHGVLQRLDGCQPFPTDRQRTHGAHGGNSIGRAVTIVERRPARDRGAVPQQSLRSVSA